MYVARDNDGSLYLYTTKPVRNKLRFDDNDEPAKHWTYAEFPSGADLMELDSSLYPNLTWEDEPIEVKLVEVDTPDPEDEVEGL